MSLAASTTLRYRLPARCVGTQSWDLLDYTLFLPSVWLVCGLGVSLRLIGPLFIVIPVGTCLLYALLRWTAPPVLLTTYVLFSAGIAGLSWFRVFPESWQVHFVSQAILRQLVPLVGFFAAAWATKAYFRNRLNADDVMRGAPLIIFLGFVVGPAVMFQQGRQYQGDDPALSVLGLYGALINNVMVTLVFVTGYIYLTRDWRRYAALLTVIAIAIFTHFSQFRLLTLIALAALFGVTGRYLIAGLVAFLLAVYAAGLNYIPELVAASPNAGIRLAFLVDALQSTKDTYGIGVGYGVESVRWQYRFPGLPLFTFLPDPNTMTPDRMLEALSTGVENSFGEALLRGGLLGLVLFTAAIFATVPPRDLPPPVQNHATIVFATMFIGCFVNSALESPISAIGHGFLYGFLIALRSNAQTNTSVPVAVSSRRPWPVPLKARQSGTRWSGAVPAPARHSFDKVR